MSKLFFDHLIVLSEVDRKIKSLAKNQEEKEELWGLIDEIVHHRVFDLILGKLPKEKHIEFMEMFHKCPNDEVYIMSYLEKATGENLGDYIKEEFKKFEKEILSELET